MDKPTDQDILDAVASGHLMATYVIKNTLRSRFNGLKTDFVRRRLQAMERAGKVERLASWSTVHHCWGIVKASQ